MTISNFYGGKKVLKSKTQVKASLKTHNDTEKLANSVTHANQLPDYMEYSLINCPIVLYWIGNN